MGGSEQPYLYDPPASRRSVAYPYSDFNPKAVTQAHYVALAERAEWQRMKAQQAGKPLINFNEHPDSYMVVATQNTNHEHMPTNTKSAVRITRWLQFTLRCFQEAGALLTLVCLICLKLKLDAPGWIMRVAPAWDAVVSMYAIYHLIRPAKRRTPASSASYHFFALFMDTGLLPFYVYIALNTYNNRAESIKAGHWTSFFASPDAASLLTTIALYGACVVGGLHLLSIGFDLYLIVMFRKIASLPPDMNPLEDNLTSRRSRSAKHKHKDSDATLTETDLDEKKRLAHLSGSTLSVDNLSRSSLAKVPEVRAMPFAHSRLNSDNSFSPHNPDSARYSQQQLDQMSVYHDARSARSSRQDLSMNGQYRPVSKHASFIEALSVPIDADINNRAYTPPPSAFMSTRFDRSKNTAEPTLPNLLPPTGKESSQQQQALLSDNWYALDEDEKSDLSKASRQTAPNHVPSRPAVLQHMRHDSFDPQPLKMNPPTPPPDIAGVRNAEDNDDDDDESPHRQHSRYVPLENSTAPAGVGRTGTVISHSSSVYSEQSDSTLKPGNTTPKGKYYGDLAAATRGVLGGRSPSPPKKESRVVSRSGVDLADAKTMYVPEESFGGKGRRQVSGKVAEEGRGGWELWKR